MNDDDIVRSDRKSFFGVVILDSFNKASQDEDKMLD